MDRGSDRHQDTDLSPRESDRLDGCRGGVTVGQAARILNCASNTIRKRCRDRQIKYSTDHRGRRIISFRELERIQKVAEIKTIRRDDVFTSGEAADATGLAPRTICKLFDAGRIRGWRVPGSKDRRIPVTCLVEFCEREGIAVDTTKFRQFSFVFAVGTSGWLDVIEDILRSLDRVVFMRGSKAQLYHLLERRRYDVTVLIDETFTEADIEPIKRSGARVAMLTDRLTLGQLKKLAASENTDDSQ